MIDRKFLCGVSTIAVLLALAPLEAAMAQESAPDANQVEEIVVTAQSPFGNSRMSVSA